MFHNICIIFTYLVVTTEVAKGDKVLSTNYELSIVLYLYNIKLS